MGAVTSHWDSASQERRALLEQLLASPSGLLWAKSHAEWVDGVVQQLFQQAIADFPSLRVSVVATGGYGRGELSPLSDVDLAVIAESESSPELDAFTRKFHRTLFDGLEAKERLRLGYAYLSARDAETLDWKGRTGFMDARLVAGSSRPFERFRSTFRDYFSAGEFILEKLRERERAFAATHDTPLVVEPHLKEGAGGLRCFHAANWLRTALDRAPLPPNAAFERVVLIRNLLHGLTGKPFDVLTRGRAAEIAELLGESIDAFEQRRVEATTELHREYLEARESILENRFNLRPGVTCVRGEARISPETPLSDAALGVALATDLDLRLEPMPTASSELGDGPSLLSAFASGETTIRNLDRCGLLEPLLPELTRCRSLMPSDAIHVFTVFEHSLRVVRSLAATQATPFFADLWSEQSRVGALVVSALLHDVGKADPSGPHAETGARMAEEVCQRWKLAPSDTEFIVWLVREHLTLDRLTRLRDVNQPQTAAELAQAVGTKERLDALTLLTVADVKAVGPDVWTPSQEVLVRELYVRTAALLESESNGSVDPDGVRRRIRAELKHRAADPEAVESFLNAMPAHYVVSTSPDTVRLHMEMAEQAKAGTPLVVLEDLPDQNRTLLTVCCIDQPRLLSRILGTLYALDLSVYGIRVNTKSGDAEIALDQFDLGFARNRVPAGLARRLHQSLMDVVEGRIQVETLLQESGKDPSRPQENFSATFVPGTPGILEVRAPRGRGMAYRLSKWIADQGWNVLGARFATWAGRGGAAFYLDRADGSPISREDVEAALARKV